MFYSVKSKVHASKIVCCALDRNAEEQISNIKLFMIQIQILLLKTAILWPFV